VRPRSTGSVVVEAAVVDNGGISVVEGAAVVEVVIGIGRLDVEVWSWGDPHAKTRSTAPMGKRFRMARANYLRLRSIESPPNEKR
jgi:hypothetical protein